MRFIVVLAVTLAGCHSGNAGPRPAAPSSDPAHSTAEATAPSLASTSTDPSTSSSSTPVSTATPTAPPATGEPEIPGLAPLPPTVATKPDPIAKLQPRFRACFQKALNEDPDAGGTIKVTLVVAADGKVTSAKVVCTTYPKPLTECLRKVYLSAELSSGPDTVTIGGPC